LQLGAASAFAQSQPLPSAPVTTPPAAGAQPPTGGPSTPPMTEPANAIDHSGVTPGANSFTEAQARGRLQRRGYAQVSQLTKDSDGIWRGSATKNGAQVHVSVDYKGHIASN
jgi:putative membrane protein